MLRHKAFIVRCNVCGHARQAIVIAQNHFELAHRTTATIYFLCVRAFFFALRVIGFNLLRFLTVEHNPGKPCLVPERNRNAVGNSLLHRVLINDRAEDVHGLLDGRTCEPDKCRVGERIMKVLRKAELHKGTGFAVLAAIFDFELFTEIELSAMRFVAEANDVPAL